MGKLDDIKAELLALAPSASVKIHESRIAEALLEARSPIDFYPTANIAFGGWCEVNRIKVVDMYPSDYVTFEKVSNA